MIKNSKVFVYTLLLLVSLAVANGTSGDDETHVENHVYVLGEKNFDKFINQNEFTVVFFYAPWCGHCVNMKPFFHNAAKLLLNENGDDSFKADKTIKLAKVDATVEQSLAARFDIDGYPTLKIIRRGQPFDYEGPRQDEKAIAEYLIKEASDSWKPPVSMVAVLSDGNFTEWVEKHDVSLVEFYSPGCVHCKRLAPNFEKAAKKLAEDPNPIPLAKVDASVELELSKKYDIKGYPTLYIFRRGRHYEYKGGRDSYDIIDFMLKSRSSKSKEVNSFNQFNVNVKKPTDLYIIGLFNDDKSSLFNIYNDFASKYPDDFNIYHTFKPNEFSKHFNSPKVPSIVVFYHDLVATKNEARFRVFDKQDATVDEIEEFVMKKSLPLVGHLGEKNRKLIYEKVKPLCYIFYDVDSELKSHIIYIRDKVAPFARKFNKIRFVIANETENAGLIKDFNLEESNSETNVVCIDENSKRYIYDQEMDGFDEEEIEEFIGKFSSGKLKPFIRSQKPPKDNAKRAVKVVVGKTFDQIVNDEKNDVVVAFITPKSDEFESLFDKLAKRFSKTKKLVFAKFDFTVNDYPGEIFQLAKAPSIFIAKAGDKKKPIAFSKSTADSLEDLVEFVEENLDNDKKRTNTKEDL